MFSESHRKIPFELFCVMLFVYDVRKKPQIKVRPNIFFRQIAKMRLSKSQNKNGPKISPNMVIQDSTIHICLGFSIRFKPFQSQALYQLLTSPYLTKTK